MSETGINARRYAWKWWVILAVIVLCLPVAWHVYLSFELRSHVRSTCSAAGDAYAGVSISVNPVTNLVSITIAMPPESDEDNPFAAFGAALGQAVVQTAGPALIEHELGTYVREHYDVCSLAIPYRVRITTVPPSPETVAKMREERRKREEQGARAKAEAEAEHERLIREYVSSNLSLEHIRIAAGEQFGTTTDGVFGTIINKGTRTIRKVTVRVYFLDDSGQPIGEKDFSPVLVTDFAIGDNTPLRPGYHKDFGYDVGGDAPSGWSKRVRAEIVDVEFSD